MARTQRFEEGEVVWHAIYQEQVTIEVVDMRMFGNDDYWVRDVDYCRYWAEDSDLEPLEVPNA